MTQPCPMDTVDSSATGFDAVLQLEVEKAVWKLEAARYAAPDGESGAEQLRRILDRLRTGAAQEGHVLAAAVCDSACRLIDTEDKGSGQQRSLREHVQALRNIVIASLQGRPYGGLEPNRA